MGNADAGKHFYAKITIQVFKNDSPKKVLIAHQSTIPHYRVPFYQAVERLRPKWWEFYVVYDLSEKAKKAFFKEQVNHRLFNFKLQKTKTYNLKLKGKVISFQTFVFRAWGYDLIVVEDALNNLSYPLSYLYRIFGKPIMSWGHGRDFTASGSSFLKTKSEQFKLWLLNRADGFFAYTNGVCKYLLNKGFDKRKIFTLNNSIDIEKERSVFKKLYSSRDELRQKSGLKDKKVLLYIGRLNKRKKLDFLIDTFIMLKTKDPSYHISIVGGGDTSFVSRLIEQCGKESVSYHGILTDLEKLAPIYVQSDLYVFPGDVGLGPLQALCYNVVPAVIESPTHNPEYEYLTHDNSLILHRRTTVKEYATAIDNVLCEQQRLSKLRSNAWHSIRHLTVENMALSFINGINTVLISKYEGDVAGKPELS